MKKLISILLLLSSLAFGQDTKVTSLKAKNINGTRYADQFANIQAAITDAGTTGSVVIPPNYAGTDTYTNPNGIQINDLRKGRSRPLDLVQDFGCKGDGVTDDYTCIQNALNVFSGQSKSGMLTCPAGTYLVGNQLFYEGSSAAGLLFVGDSAYSRGLVGCHIKYNGATGGAVLYTLGANNFELRNVELDANSIGSYNWYADATGEYSASTNYAGSSLARSSNLVTATTATHAFTPGDAIRVAGCSDSTFNGTFWAYSVPSTTTVTYLQKGADGSATGCTVTRYKSSISSGNRVTDSILSGAKSRTLTVTASSCAANVITLTFSTDHGMSLRDLFYLYGATPTQFNSNFTNPSSTASDSGTTTVATIPASNQITYASGCSGTGSDGSVYTPSYGVRISHCNTVGCTPTPQNSEWTITRGLIKGGGDGISLAAVHALNNGNTKNYRFTDVDINGWRNGLSGLTSGMVKVSGVNFNNYCHDGSVCVTNGADISGATNLTINGGESESEKQRFFICTTGSNPAFVYVSGMTWQGSTPSDDYAVICPANIVFNSVDLRNVRAYGTSVAKVQTAITFVNGTAGSFTSLGSSYQSAPDGFVPVYDMSGNQFNNAAGYFQNKTASVTSIGDMGGVAGGSTLIKLQNVIPLSQIIPWTKNYSTEKIPITGTIRWRRNALDTLKIRNSADNADLSVLTTDANDSAVVGNSTTGTVIGAGTAIKQHLSATATLDFAAITAPNCAADLTITVTGAAVGDTVELGAPAALAGVQYFAWVSATDTVTVRACAFTGTPDPASGTFRVDVWKH